MKIIYLLFFVLIVTYIFSSFDKEPKNDSLIISSQDIIVTWKQAVPTILNATDSLSGITEDWVFEETYFLGPDNRFSIFGITYLKIGNQGSYTFDPSIPEIDFSCEGAYVDIGGVPVQLEKEPQRWKWEIHNLKKIRLRSISNYLIKHPIHLWMWKIFKNT